MGNVDVSHNEAPRDSSELLISSTGSPGRSRPVLTGELGTVNWPDLSQLGEGKFNFVCVFSTGLIQH